MYRIRERLYIKPDSGRVLAPALSHPKPLAVRHTQDFLAFGAEINIASAQNAFQLCEPHLVKRLGAVGADGKHVVSLL